MSEIAVNLFFASFPKLIILSHEKEGTGCEERGMVRDEDMRMGNDSRAPTPEILLIMSGSFCILLMEFRSWLLRNRKGRFAVWR